jgi:hypothetical protein
MSSRPLTKQRPDLSARLPRSGRQRGKKEGSNLDFNSIHSSEFTTQN